MLIHADFSRRVIVRPGDAPWVASPAGGVERVMLDRVGAELARATSLVRYAPGASFPPHAHPGGEEILVLEGTFADEDGAWTAGCYLRNPPGSRHAPYTTQGAVIFVKLMQMRAPAVPALRVDTHDPAGWQDAARRRIRPLFTDAEETVFMQRLRGGEPLELPDAPGAEVLVVDGTLRVDAHHAPRWSWVRMTAGDRPPIHAASDGALLYVKLGLPMPLPAAPAAPGGRP